MDLCQEIGDLLSREGIAVQMEGKNQFIFSTGEEYFRFGGLLFKAGYILERQGEYAKRHGISRQAVQNRLKRECSICSLRWEKEIHIASAKEG